MPLAPPEVLLPLAAGAAVLAVVLMVALLVRRARRRHADRPPAAPPAPSPAGSVWREPEAGSGRTVADAVERVRAARETHTGTRGDARDRLLAVLLQDPVRAVGAAVEVEASRRQLDRLADAVRHERATLGDALGRLSAAGLDDGQLARLAGLEEDELRLLLSETTSR